MEEGGAPRASRRIIVGVEVACWRVLLRLGRAEGGRRGRPAPAGLSPCLGSAVEGVGRENRREGRTGGRPQGRPGGRGRTLCRGGLPPSPVPRGGSGGLRPPPPPYRRHALFDPCPKAWGGEFLSGGGAGWGNAARPGGGGVAREKGLCRNVLLFCVCFCWLLRRACPLPGQRTGVCKCIDVNVSKRDSPFFWSLACPHCASAHCGCKELRVARRRSMPGCIILKRARV